MEQQLIPADNAFQTGALTKHTLYTKYSGMLLGYIAEVVKNNKLAEQYLVDLFTELNESQIKQLTQPGVNTFIGLQQMARKKLAAFAATLADCKPDARPKTEPIKNSYIERMNAEQQFVFCGIHYHSKTIGTLAIELDKTEDRIKQILKESFTIIRSTRDTATVHK